VQNVSGRSRFSFPFFFDPGFDVHIEPIDLSGIRLQGDGCNVNVNPRMDAKYDEKDDSEERWDHTSVHEFKGTYGDYVLGKVSKVFPELRRSVM